MLVASKNNLSLAVYATEKETPYAADGIKRETTPRAEIYLTAPTGVESYDISFTYEGKEYGGDMSFDNVKLEYFYSCSLDLSAAAEIVFTVAFDETTARADRSLRPHGRNPFPRGYPEQSKRQRKSETFNSMTDRNGFAGEIYMRLIYEDAPLLLRRNHRQGRQDTRPARRFHGGQNPRQAPDVAPSFLSPVSFFPFPWERLSLCCALLFQPARIRKPPYT